jgi:predicted DNA-binding transcriptional regulator YafY
MGQPSQTLRTGSVRDVCKSSGHAPHVGALLRLLSIMQAREFWTGGELASRLEVTERTLRRDVHRLRSLGYPVHSTSGTSVWRRVRSVHG